MYIKYSLLKEIPVFRIVVVLLLGIILSKYIQSNNLYVASIIIALFTIVLIIAFRFHVSPKRLRANQLVSSTCSFITILLLGYALGHSHLPTTNLSHFTNMDFTNETGLYELVLVEPIDIKSKSLKIVGKLAFKINKTSLQQLSGEMICYLEKDSLSNQLETGDTILIKSELYPISPAKNPREFNYAKYLNNKGIYASVYLSADKWLLKNKAKNKSFKKLILSLRSFLEDHIQSYILEDREEQIAQAILIGEKDYLDIETKKIYASSGAMHILAVSGLHVGIVYLLFSYLLFFLKSKRFFWLRPLLLVLLIWLYAFLTGGSSSVLRASTMFTFIAIGQTYKRHVNIYNMLASSALILILVNPNIVVDVGFQLSYIAVFGILFLQAKIYQLYIPTNYILDKIWALSSVSIAAQIATFPISLFYFHQFPNLFLLSNLLVIPAAIVIVYLGMALFLVSFSPMLSNFIGSLLEKVIYYLNEFILIIDHIPFAVSKNIHFDILTCLLCYTMIISLVISLAYRNKTALRLCLMLATILLGFSSLKLWNSNSDISLAVYNIPNYSAIEIKNGLRIQELFDEELILNQSKINYHIAPNQMTYLTNDKELIERQEDYQYFSLDGNSILIIGRDFRTPNDTLRLDYLIVSHQDKLYLKNLVSLVKAKKYIFDSSNNPKQHYYWKKDCESLNLDCYFVSDSFAFVEKLNKHELQTNRISN